MRASGLRTLSRVGRGRAIAGRASYATVPAGQSGEFSVSEANGGVKIATAAPDSADSQTGAITVVVKAGSRYEPGPGMAHVLKNYVFKGTSKRSALSLVRETELYGGVLSSSLSREHLILSAEFLKGDEGYFAEVLGDALTQAKFAAHEYNEEVLPQVAAEYETAIRDPVTYALDLAHQLAFRTGLGNSLFASPHTAVDYDSATAFARATLSKPSNFAVLASGVDQSALKSFVSEFFVNPSGGSSPTQISTPKAQYYGGEVRVPAVGHGSTNDEFLVAFKGGAASQPEYVVLRHLLGGESSVKWAEGASPLSKLVSGSSAAASVNAFNLAYTDAGLFGLTVSAPTEHVQSLAEKAVQELKNVVKGGLKDEQLKQAIAKAKFAVASSLESRSAKLEHFGGLLINGGEASSLEKVFAQLDAVSGDAVAKAAKAAVESKPTTVAIGDTHKLPYSDSIGL